MIEWTILLILVLGFFTLCIYKRKLNLLSCFLLVELVLFLIMILLDIVEDKGGRLMIEIIGSAMFFLLAPLIFLVLVIKSKKQSTW